MKILVTGGNGFLGKHLVSKLELESQCHFWTPTSKTLNLLDKNFCSDIINKFSPDIILHMAAVCGGIQANKNNPAVFLRDNTQMALNVYEMAREYNVKKVYSLGSVCSYPKYCSIPFKEDDIWNGPAEETNFPYGQAKRTLMMLGQTYRAQYQIGGAHLIPVNMYGSKDHFDLQNSHVIPALIRKFVTAVVENQSYVFCWGTGSATREFLYAEDCAEAIVKAVVSGLDTNLPINLGTGKDISIYDLAHLIGKLTGFKGEIVFTGEISDGQPKRCLDVSRARDILGWEAKTNLEEGLKKTVEWYMENYE